MRKMKFVALVLALIFFGCKSTPKTETTETAKNIEQVKVDENESNQTKIEFGELSWILEQISPSFWPTPLKADSKMFITFHMPVSQNVKIADIEKIFISSPKDMWLLENESIKNIVEMNTKDKKLVIKRLHCVSGQIPLGAWTVELTLKDGGFAKKTVEVSGLKDYVKLENSESESDTSNTQKNTQKFLVPKAENENEVSCLAVPTIKSVSKDKDFIEIRFSINDKRVKNGYFWFDVPGEIYYRDSGSMIDASGNPVNGCRKFSTDGSECSYILRKDKTNSAWFSKIVAAYFVVADVNRVESPWEERIRSISEKASIK